MERQPFFKLRKRIVEALGGKLHEQKKVTYPDKVPPLGRNLAGDTDLHLALDELFYGPSSPRYYELSELTRVELEARKLREESNPRKLMEELEKAGLKPDSYGRVLKVLQPVFLGFNEGEMVLGELRGMSDDELVSRLMRHTSLSTVYLEPATRILRNLFC